MKNMKRSVLSLILHETHIKTGDSKSPNFVRYKMNRSRQQNQQKKSTKHKKKLGKIKKKQPKFHNNYFVT